MRPWKITAVLGMACVLTVSSAFGSMAWTERPETIDEETWARLHDNVLEYDEIGNLVEYYNPTYRQLVQNLQVNLQPLEDAAAQLRGAAKDMIADANGIKEDDPMSEAIYRGSAKMYQDIAKQYEKGIKSARSSARSGFNQARKQLTSGVQQLFLGYCQALASKEMADTAAQLAQEAYNSTVTRRSLGMATDTEVQSALNSLQSAEAGQQSLNDTLNNLRQNLQFMAGWSADAQVAVGACPVPDLSKIDAMNPENDLETAISNNYTYIDQRKASGKGTANRDAKFRTLDESEAKIKIQLESLYQAVLQNKAAYEASRLALESAQLTMNGNNLKYQQGMLGKLEYLQLKVAYLQQKAAADAASISLVQAMENYCWAVEGLADITQ